MKKAFLLRLLVALLFVSAGSATIANYTGSSYAKAAADGTGGVYNTQVINYLTSYGYTGICITNIDASGTRTSTSTNHPGYVTYTYVLNGMIVGHEDVATNR
jgi:hypothetical protein